MEQSARSLRRSFNGALRFGWPGLSRWRKTAVVGLAS
jgi:hypothetical protein